mgnify:CR=1 FL=1
MADRIEEGGPAFPLADQPMPNGRWQQGSPGMSLRDWFAGQALMAAWDARDKGYFKGDDSDMAECAYQIADAMLSARQKGGV